jgi:hypothetical protein
MPLSWNEVRDRAITFSRELLHSRENGPPKKARTSLDPACGCGNFLVITYRELRLLELEVLRAQRVGRRVPPDRMATNVPGRAGGSDLRDGQLI